MHHENTCGSINVTCPECHLNYPRRDAPSHTESKCTREQLRQLRQEFTDKMKLSDLIIQKHSETITHQNEIIETLRQEFATDQQRQDQVITKLPDRLTQIETKLASLHRQVERLAGEGNIQSYLLAVSLQHVVSPTRHKQDIFARTYRLFCLWTTGRNLQSCLRIWGVDDKLRKSHHILYFLTTSQLLLVRYV